jgi:hypothetical protein
VGGMIGASRDVDFSIKATWGSLRTKLLSGEALPNAALTFITYVELPIGNGLVLAE